MKKSIKIAFLIALTALLVISCNFPVTTLVQKVTGGNGDETSGDADDKAPLGGLFSGADSGNDSGSSTGNNYQTKLTEKPLTGELEIEHAGFWPTTNGSSLTIAVLVKNTDPKLVIFHEGLTFELADQSGQSVSLQENLQNTLEDMVLYPEQEYLWCRNFDLNGTEPKDVGSINVTMDPEMKGVDLGVTTNPFQIVSSKIRDTSAGGWMNLRSSMVVSNNSNRIAFFPYGATGGFDSAGNLVACGYDWDKLAFLVPNGQGGTYNWVLGKEYPVTFKNYIAQTEYDYTSMAENFDIVDSDQLSLSNVDFIQNGDDLYALFDLINNTEKSGLFDYLIEIYAYDSDGNVIGAQSLRQNALFAPGTTYGSYQYKQSFVTSESVAKIDAQVITLAVNKQKFDIPTDTIKYGKPVFNSSDRSIKVDVTNQVNANISLWVAAVCKDASGNMVGYSDTLEYIEPGATQTIEILPGRPDNSACENAASIDLNTLKVSMN